MAGLGVRALARKYGVHRRTVREALTSAWPKPRKKLPARRSRLPFKPAIDQILWADLDAPRGLSGRWLARTAWRAGPQFTPVDRWLHVERRQLTTKAIADAVNMTRERAKPPRPMAHDFRSTFIGDQLDSGTDLAPIWPRFRRSSGTRAQRRPRGTTALTRRAAVARLRIPAGRPGGPVTELVRCDASGGHYMEGRC
ncbi:hypothetical protein [Nonomuraea sp. NPDC049158]|uniref:hypothetical protein n=1 Tax=Nonomuraea sp. NPDC049158 TaxID=3155649 RepID=UPI0033F04F0E